MPHKQKKHAETEMTINILQQKGNRAVAKEMGRLLTLEELPKFLSSRMRELEDTKYYNKHGHTWFYLGTKGMRTNGHHRFNREAETLQEMFKPVTEGEYSALPFGEKAGLWAGKGPLIVSISRDVLAGAWHVGISGDFNSKGVAPVMVVKQTKAQAKANDKSDLKNAKRK